jgi:hypothetical protein
MQPPPSVVQCQAHPLLQIFPGPNGTVTILAVDMEGEWVEDRRCRMEDVTPEYLADMERRARDHRPRLHLV